MQRKRLLFHPRADYIFLIDCGFIFPLLIIFRFRHAFQQAQSERTGTKITTRHFNVCWRFPLQQNKDPPLLAPPSSSSWPSHIKQRGSGQNFVKGFNLCLFTLLDKPPAVDSESSVGASTGNTGRF